MQKLKKEFSFAGFDFPKHVFSLPTGKLNPKQKRYTPGYYHKPTPNNTDGIGFYLSDSEGMGFALRWKWCDDVADNINHTGWFCDEYQDSKIRGIVLRLPKNRGFLAGWSMGEGMASELDYTIFDDEIVAAYAADRMAEHAAEREREYQESQNQDE